MFLLLALLSRLAPLLPQSWRIHVGRQVATFLQHRIARASPRDAALLLGMCEALLHVAETREEISAAIGFAHRTQATLATRDRSGHFNRYRPRRMRFARRREYARSRPAAPHAHAPRALDLSG